jgi:hypothetical protein
MVASSKVGDVLVLQPGRSVALVLSAGVAQDREQDGGGREALLSVEQQIRFATRHEHDRAEEVLLVPDVLSRVAGVERYQIRPERLDLFRRPGVRPLPLRHLDAWAGRAEQRTNGPAVGFITLVWHARNRNAGLEPFLTAAADPESGPRLVGTEFL